MIDNFFYISAFIFIQILIIYKNKKISKILNLFDYPDSKRKKHLMPTSQVGGFIVIFSIFYYSIFIFLKNLNNYDYLDLIFFNFYDYFIFLIFCIILSFVGYIDDKINIKSYYKLAIIALVIYFYLLLNQKLLINNIRISFYFRDIYLNNLSLIFTLLCFLLFINSINMFDGIDGQVGLYSVWMIFFLFSVNGLNYFLVTLFFSFITFLILNLKKKMFLGDNGTILIGFIFSFLFIKHYNYGYIHFADQIFLIMLIPGLDMFRLFIERIFNKKNPFSADDNHLHHLMERKIGKYKTITLIQLIISIPIILSFYFNIFFINILMVFLYFIIIILLKNNYSYKN